MEIKYELTKTPKEKPTGALGFGHIFTDHMFVMDYDEGKGWHDARIVPYQPLVLDPSALVFHYAQECFELFIGDLLFVGSFTQGINLRTPR